jgi:peptidoglycan/LPS O-acetylase OafA/YrhL
MNSYANQFGFSFVENTSSEMSPAGILFTILLFGIFGIVIISTYLHIQTEKYLENSIVSSFTLVSTLKNLMKTRENNKLGCINGLKVLCFSWVVYGHCFVYKSYSSVVNIEKVPEVMKTWWLEIGNAAFFSVDIFFFITGFLMSYFLLIDLEKRHGKVSWGILYLHRVLRLLPTLAFALGIDYFILPSLGSGPIWENVKKSSLDCEKYWWTNFLFLNNFIPDGNGNDCFSIGWYLANDMQFFLIGPPLVFLYFISHKKTRIWGLFIVIAIAGIVLDYFLAYSYNLRVNPLDPANGKAWFQQYYTKPYARFVPYIEGIMCGALYLYYYKVSEKQEIMYNDPISRNIVNKITNNRIVSMGLVLIGIALMYFLLLFKKNINLLIWL